MAMQAAGTLQHTVNRRQIGEQHVKVDVQRLLGDLGGDHQPALARSMVARVTKIGQYLLFFFQPVAQRKARVEQRYLRSRDGRGQARIGAHCVGHRVANPSHAFALGQRSAHVIVSFGLIRLVVHFNGARDVGTRIQRFLRRDRLPAIPARCQWIRLRAQRGRTCLAPARIRVQHRLLHVDWQCGGKQDHRAICAGMKLQQHFEHLLHVGVAGMHLVDDEYLAKQSEQAQRLVLAVQDRQQGLVDGADTGRRQQRALAMVRQPGGAAR